MRASACDPKGDRKTGSRGEDTALREDVFPVSFVDAGMQLSGSTSSTQSLPCCFKSCASVQSARCNCPLLTHCCRRRWQVSCGGYLLGNSCQLAPVASTHNTALSTARVSVDAVDSAGFAEPKIGCKTAHCLLLTSQRPFMAVRRSRAFLLWTFSRTASSLEQPACY
jgi:hypothetical protein